MTNNKSSILSKANSFSIEDDAYIKFDYRSKNKNYTVIKIPTARIVEDWLRHQTLIDWSELEEPEDDFDI